MNINIKTWRAPWAPPVIEYKTSELEALACNAVKELKLEQQNIARREEKRNKIIFSLFVVALLIIIASASITLIKKFKSLPE